MSEDTAPAPAVPTKADPETLTLRARPPRVTRFRRGAIIALAGLGSTAIATVAWMALKPVSLELVGSGEEGAVGAGAPAEALAGAPASYEEVPRLGPPLPGDLGKPILDHQREAGLAMSADPAADAAARAAQEAEAERQRVAAEQRAARQSHVMLQLASASSAPASAVRVDDPLLRGRDTSQPAAAADPNGQQRTYAIIGRSHDGEDVNPHALVPLPSPWTLQAGSVIAASLITGLNSDLPGLVTAQVTENVHDSVTGRALLIPQGSRLIGSYDNIVGFGQTRALVVWQRIILPDGSSIRIDNVPAADTQGYAGLADRVDRHTWQLLKGVALSTLLGVGTELSWGSGESELVEAIRDGAQQSGARAGDEVVRSNLDVPPTLRVRPGWPLRVVVNKDIVFDRPWPTSER